MAKSRQSIVALKASTADAELRFTDVEHVMAYLNSTLSEDLQRIQTLSLDLESFFHASNASQQERSAEWQRFTHESVATRDATIRRLNQAIATAERKSTAIEAALERLGQAMTIAETKSKELDTAITAAQATAEYVSALGEMVSEDHESRWAKTIQQFQQQSTQLSQHVTDQVATQFGEFDGANRAWRTQIEAASQTWRKQAEAANHAWQVAQAQIVEQWRDETSHDLIERTEASLRQARTATDLVQQQAEQLTQFAQRHDESQQELQRQLETDHAAWEAARREQDSEIVTLHEAVASLKKLLYGGGAAIALLTLLCIIALVR